MGGLFSQLILEPNGTKTEVPFAITTGPTILEVIIFVHCLLLFNHRIQKKMLMVPQYYCSGTLIGLCVYLLLKASKDLFRESPCTYFSKAVPSYTNFDNSIFQFSMLATLFDGLTHLPQEKKLVDVGSPLEDEEGLDADAFQRSTDTDETLRYVTYLILDHLDSSILNCNLYSKGKD